MSTNTSIARKPVASKATTGYTKKAQAVLEKIAISPELYGRAAGQYALKGIRMGSAAMAHDAPMAADLIRREVGSRLAGSVKTYLKRSEFPAFRKGWRDFVSTHAINATKQ